MTITILQNFILKFQAWSNANKLRFRRNFQKSICFGKVLDPKKSITNYFRRGGSCVGKVNYFLNVRNLGGRGSPDYEIFNYVIIKWSPSGGS